MIDFLSTSTPHFARSSSASFHLDTEVESSSSLFQRLMLIWRRLQMRTTILSSTRQLALLLTMEMQLIQTEDSSEETSHLLSLTSSQTSTQLQLVTLSESTGSRKSMQSMRTSDSL
jgi:hypothetical protein